MTPVGRNTLALVIILAMLLAVLTLTFGCEALNVSSDPGAVPVVESVYVLEPPPTTQPADTIDLDAPFAALRVWIRDTFNP